MKTIFYLFLPLLIFSSCKKESGAVVYSMKFTTEKITLKSTLNGQSDTLYTQFGSYITSLTPTKLVAHLWTIGYIDRVIVPGTNDAQMLQYINQNGDKLPYNDPLRTVDFSKNTSVTFNPVVFGRLNNDGYLTDAQINFRYFYFMPNYFYHEIVLPSQYQGVNLSMFPVGSVVNNVLKIRHNQMLHKIFPNTNILYSDQFFFFFGNTDSTFVVNPNGEEVPTSVNNPIITAPTRTLIIRSNKYKSTIYNAPINGQTKVMYGVVSFDTNRLIQVYAGADNQPYTRDDVFVYAPRFWERITSSLEIN